MKKQDTDIRDIYRSEEPVPESKPSREMQDLIGNEIRKRRIFNISATLLTLALTAFLTISFVNDYLSAVSNKTVLAAEKQPYFAAYTLPAEEQWALEYRQVVKTADGGEPPGPKSFSARWVNNAAYHIIMGEQALRMNELPAAQNHFEAAINTFPAMTGIRHYLGEVYLKRQFFEKAVEQLRKAMEEQPSIEVLNNLGAAYIGIEDYEKAETLLKQAVQQQPELAGCYKNLALLYQKAGRTNDAVAAFEKYVSLVPKDVPLIRNYVVYLTSAGRMPEAIAFLERIENSSDPLAVSLLLARTAAQNTDTERAVRALRDAAHFLTPRQVIAEMHDAVFEKVARTESFEALLHQLELAAVSLSTNLDTKGVSGN